MNLDELDATLDEPEIDEDEDTYDDDLDKALVLLQDQHEFLLYLAGIADFNWRDKKDAKFFAQMIKEFLDEFDLSGATETPKDTQELNPDVPNNEQMERILEKMHNFGDTR